MSSININVVSKLSPRQQTTIQSLLQNAFPSQESYFKDIPEYNPNTQYIIAETEGVTAGFCSLHFYHRVSGICTAVIEDVVVAPSYRRGGLGQRILDSALENASKKADKIILQTEIKNKNFYLRSGLKPSDPLITMSKYI